MKTISSEFAKLSQWFKKRTEGRRIMQWISYVMIFSVLIVFMVEYPVRAPDWRFYGTVLILAILLVLHILWDKYHRQISSSQRRTAYRWGFILLTDLMVLGAIALTGHFVIVFLLFMEISEFAEFLGVWPAGAIFSALNLAAMLGILAVQGTPVGGLIQAGSELMIGMIFVLVFIYLEQHSFEETLRAEQLLKDLQAANLELKAAHQKEKDLALAEERMRLARDIHDGLGHHLTVLSVQLQAADKLVERNPQAAAEAIRLSRAEAQAALEEVRRSVGMMRRSPADSQPLPDFLANLVRDFSANTGLQVQFEPVGTPVELAPFAQHTLFRAVQECLTNVQKHGQGVKTIRVRLEYAAQAVRLAVRDDGQMPQAAASGHGGYGLKGLQERVDQLGGEFRCGPGALGGFEVDVSIPLEEAVHDQSPAGG
jgi:signal transduction histidine kinase